MEEDYQGKIQKHNGIEVGLSTEVFAHFIEAAIANEKAYATLVFYLPRKCFEEMLDELLRRCNK